MNLIMHLSLKSNLEQVSKMPTLSNQNFSILNPLTTKKLFGWNILKKRLMQPKMKQNSFNRNCLSLKMMIFSLAKNKNLEQQTKDILTNKKSLWNHYLMNYYGRNWRHGYQLKLKNLKSDPINKMTILLSSHRF